MPVEKTPPDRVVADTIRQTTEPDAVFQPPVGPHPGQPKSVGGYEIIGEIGRGGSGVIYRAYDAELKRYVAIKMLFSGIEVSPYKLSQFRGEAEIVAQLAHPNIVQVFDIGDHDGHPFLALELVEGGSLDRHTERKPQTPRFAAEAVETLARAIHVAHSQNIIHRDLKPANVLVSKDGTLKITDFGLAKRLVDTPAGSRTGDIKGTPSYMAPEQADGRVRECGPATDVYALGAILYELLTGRPPFVGADVIETLEQVRLADPPPPSKLVPKVPRDLCTICLKCLEKNPERRYDSAVDLADDLKRWKGGEAILARPVSVVERVARFVRRRPVAAAAVAASAVAAGALGLFALEASKRRHEAELYAQAEGFLQNAFDEINRLILDDPEMGRLKELDPVRGRLIAVYGGLIDRQLKASGNRSEALALACENHGRLLDKTGDKRAALKPYERAEEIYAGLAQAGPAGYSASHRLAMVRFKRGLLYRDLAQLPEANAAYDQALECLDALVAADAQSPAYRRDLAEIWHERGRLYDLSKGKPQALEAFRRGLVLREALVNEYPNDVGHLRDLARSHGFIGDVEMDTLAFPAARVSYQKSLDLRVRIAAETGGEAESLFQLARGHLNFGRLAARERNYPASLDALTKTRTIQQQLVEAKPAIADYRADLLFTLTHIADILIRDTQPERRAEAVRLLADAQAQYPASRSAERANADVRSRLAAVHVLLALAAAGETPAAARPEQMRPEIDAALSLLNDAIKARHFADDFFCLAQAQALRAELAGNDPDLQAAAVAALRKAIAANYRGKHPADLKASREFREMGGRGDFAQLIADYKANWPADPAPMP